MQKHYITMLFRAKRLRQCKNVPAGVQHVLLLQLSFPVLSLCSPLSAAAAY